MKVGLFFGTFNPLHNAHIAICNKLLENKNFHEYYNFKNGDCLGANNFSWSAALYLDLKFN